MRRDESNAASTVRAAAMAIAVINGETYEAAGRRAGISRERARQLVKRAVRKARHPSRWGDRPAPPRSVYLRDLRADPAHLLAVLQMMVGCALHNAVLSGCGAVRSKT